MSVKTDKTDIKLDSVTKRYDGNVIVDKLSLEVRSGQFLSILGPSGCGKTTTLRMIGGFIEPDEGSVYIDGADVTAQSPAQRSTSMVFQDYALFPHMTVRQNIGFGLKMQGISKVESNERVEEALRMVGLEGYGERKPSKLSGGQRQRIALARSLVMRPVVLLLDEPLGALDAQIRKQMQLELKNIQKSLGQTFVYVTHDQEEAMTMSDLVAIMRDGIIEQLGTPEEVYDSPASLFVAKFIGDCATIDGKCISENGDFTCTSLGEIKGRITAEAFTGDAVVCLRPENVLFTKATDGKPNKDYSFTATLERKVFKGLNTWMAANCNNQQFICEVTGKSPLNEGDEILVSFNSNDALVVPYQDYNHSSGKSEEGIS